MRPASRLIPLRRPPTIRVVAEPFVPRGVALDEVDRRWAALRDRNAAFHDGRLLHVFGVHRNGHGGATIHVAECAYRFHAVSIDGQDTGVRPLGAKGIVTCREGGLVLVGRRSRRVAAYAGCWEFAPGGGIEPGATAEETIERELREETGLSLADEGAGGGPTATPPRPSAAALLFDGAVRSWEVVLTIGLRTPRELPDRTAEYDALRWIAIGEMLGPANDPAAPHAPPDAPPHGPLDAPLTPAARTMLALLRQTGGSSTQAPRHRRQSTGRPASEPDPPSPRPEGSDR